MKRVIWSPLIALGLLLVGCGGNENTGVIVDRDAAVGGGETRIIESVTTLESEEPTASGRQPEDGPKIEEVRLIPDPPVATGPFRVEPIVDSPAPGPLHLTYEWYVNGRAVLGVLGDTLAQDDFVRGDLIQVSILASDYNGRVDSVRVRGVQVANSTPQVVQGVGGTGQMDGSVFRAMDPDGDPVRWSIEGGPPGLSIHPTSGKLQVDARGVYEQGDYDVEIVATDPHGGAGRMGFRVNLGGSVASHKEMVEVQDARVISNEAFSTDELEKRVEEAFERMENMSPEELEAYLEKTSAERDEAAAAAEVPLDAPPSPY